MRVATSRKWVAVMVEKDEQKHQDRVDAILELKANTEKVSSSCVHVPHSGRAVSR